MEEVYAYFSKSMAQIVSMSPIENKDLEKDNDIVSGVFERTNIIEDIMSGEANPLYAHFYVNHKGVLLNATVDTDKEYVRWLAAHNHTIIEMPMLIEDFAIRQDNEEAVIYLNLIQYPKTEKNTFIVSNRSDDDFQTIIDVIGKQDKTHFMDSIYVSVPSNMCVEYEYKSSGEYLFTSSEHDEMVLRTDA